VPISQVADRMMGSSGNPISSACRAMGCWGGHWLQLGTTQWEAWELLTPWLYLESQDFQIL